MGLSMGSLQLSVDSLLVLTAPSGSLWGLMGSLWAHYGSQWVSLWIPMGLDMDLHGLYGVPISPNRSLCITMGFYRGAYGMPMGPVTDLYGSIQIPMWVPMGSLWFSMDSVSVLAAPSGSLWGLWGSPWVLMGFQ